MKNSQQENVFKIVPERRDFDDQPNVFWDRTIKCYVCTVHKPSGEKQEWCLMLDDQHVQALKTRDFSASHICNGQLCIRWNKGTCQSSIPIKSIQDASGKVLDVPTTQETLCVQRIFRKTQKGCLLKSRKPLIK